MFAPPFLAPDPAAVYSLAPHDAYGYSYDPNAWYDPNAGYYDPYGLYGYEEYAVEVYESPPFDRTPPPGARLVDTRSGVFWKLPGDNTWYPADTWDAPSSPRAPERPRPASNPRSPRRQRTVRRDSIRRDRRSRPRLARRG